MEIIEIFDECLERILDGQQTVDDCLARYPELRDELESLLIVALAIQKSAPASLSTPASSRIRNNLQARFADKHSQSQPTLRLLQSAVVRLAAALVIALSIGGVAVASAGGSLPETPLYPLKQAIEQAQLLVTRDAEQQAELHLMFAERRLQETQLLSDKGEIGNISSIESFENETEQALKKLDSLPEAKKSSIAEKIITLEERRQQVLTQALENAPESAQQGIEKALERSKRGHERAAEVLEGKREPDRKHQEKQEKESASELQEREVFSSATPTLVSAPGLMLNTVDDEEAKRSEKNVNSHPTEMPVPVSTQPVGTQPYVDSPSSTMVPQPASTPNRAEGDKTKDQEKPTNRGEPRTTVPVAKPAPQPASLYREEDKDKEHERRLER